MWDERIVIFYVYLLLTVGNEFFSRTDTESLFDCFSFLLPVG